MTDLRDLASRFAIPGAFVAVGPLGSGHINETFVACFEQGARQARYVFQRLNRQVFTDPAAVMERTLPLLENRELADETIAILGEHLSKAALANVVANLEQVVSADELHEDEAAFVDALIQTWQIDSGSEG